MVSFHLQSSVVTFYKSEPRVSVRVRKDSLGLGLGLGLGKI